MTGMDDPNLPGSAPGADEDDDDQAAVRRLLRRAMAEPEPPADLLRGVQRKIRQRSRGRFFSDGWSTSRGPVSVYIVTSLVMLLVLTFLYFVLVEGGPIKLL